MPVKFYPSNPIDALENIILKDDAPFSFDLQVSAQYIKETTLDAPLVQSRGRVTQF